MNRFVRRLRDASASGRAVVRVEVEPASGCRISAFSLPTGGNWIGWMEAADESDIWLATFR